MELNFPMEKYGQVKQETITLLTALEKAKVDWLRVRSTLDPLQTNELDEQFKVAFEQRGDKFGSSMEWQEIAEKLQSLVLQGAAASLLDDHELGSYNLATLISQMDSITDTTVQGLATKIIWLTIIAEANLRTQKAYAGNGGAISLEWICVYLASGIGDYRLQDLDQYTCCYAIFGWIINDFPRAQSTDHFFPFNTFLACLKNSLNKEGLTPLALAMKNNRTELIQLLK